RIEHFDRLVILDNLDTLYGLRGKALVDHGISSFHQVKIVDHVAFYGLSLIIDLVSQHFYSRKFFYYVGYDTVLVGGESTDPIGYRIFHPIDRGIAHSYLLDLVDPVL